MTLRRRTHAAPRPAPALLCVEGLSVRFTSPGREGVVVRDLDLAVDRGETLTLVGESGSGKSVCVRALTGLLPPQIAAVSGRALWEGRDLLTMPPARRREILGAGIGMVFQEPAIALSPTRTIGRLLTEVLTQRTGDRGDAAKARALQALAEAGIPDPGAVASSYCWQLSGGLAQRAAIAAAMILAPALLVADEPTTALDVTTQAALVRSLVALTRRRGMALLFITHDLSLARLLPGRTLVLYAGRRVEEGPAAAVLDRPRHPYTGALMGCVPGRAVDRGALLRPLPGRLPLPGEEATGCPFAPRCSRAGARCAQMPQPATVDGRVVACHHPLEDEP
ncbi:MAG: ABC transporter ATP-binding protein [Pseudomonadota bacterium]